MKEFDNSSFKENSDCFNHCSKDISDQNCDREENLFSSPVNNFYENAGDICFEVQEPRDEVGEKSVVDQRFDLSYQNVSSSPRNLISFDSIDESCVDNQDMSFVETEDERDQNKTFNYESSGTYKLIKNGKHLAAKKVMNTAYRFKDTSRFDALMEIIVRAYENNENLKKFFNCNKGCNKNGFMQAVVNYNNEKNIRLLYDYR